MISRGNISTCPGLGHILLIVLAVVAPLLILGGTPAVVVWYRRRQRLSKLVEEAKMARRASLRRTSSYGQPDPWHHAAPNVTSTTTPTTATTLVPKLETSPSLRRHAGTDRSNPRTPSPSPRRQTNGSPCMGGSEGLSLKQRQVNCSPYLSPRYVSSPRHKGYAGVTVTPDSCGTDTEMDYLSSSYGSPASVRVAGVGSHTAGYGVVADSVEATRNPNSYSVTV